MVRFLSALMGTGKSSYMIRWIKEHPNEKILVAAITLSEAERYAEECQLLIAPDFEESFISKSDYLLNALKMGKSIAITHALFIRMNKKHLQYIKEHGYVLIMDEALTGVISPISTRKHDLNTLTDSSIIEIDETNHGKVSWIKPKNYDSFPLIKEAIFEGELYHVGGCYFVSIINIELFTSFREVTVLTYLAEYSLLYLLFQVKCIKTEIFTLLDGELKSINLQKYSGKKFKHLINIDNTEGRIIDNLSLSRSGWTKMSPQKMKLVSKYINGYLTNMKARQKEILWTTFKPEAKKMWDIPRTKPKYTEDNFLQHSARGTNDYSDRKYLVYALDKNAHPGIVAFLNSFGIPFRKGNKSVMLEQDYWRLGEMLQWIWRSAIRKSQPEEIFIYIPSPDMKNLLETWINR